MPVPTKSRPTLKTARAKKLQAFLASTDFYQAPASTRFHGAYSGGLSSHSLNVYANLCALTKLLGLEWKDPDSPYVVAMGHDVCKIGAYQEQEDGSFVHNPNHPKGHGDLSISRLKAVIDLTEEEEACIRWHMGAFDDRENWNKYTGAIHKFPNVLWTHTADMMAAHMDEVDE